MSTIKFTTDGKKVSVIGKLNQTEWIVQEIYVAEDGSEIPAGENFVVKSILDCPAKSWKEKNLKELEEKYAREERRWENKLEDMYRTLNIQYARAEAKAKALANFAGENGANCDQLQTFIDFMSGRITHFFQDSCPPRIFSFDDISFDEDRDYGRIKTEGVKLFSLLGKSGGDLSYRIHRYTDGLGSSSGIFPHCSYESALRQAQSVFDKKCTEYVEENRNFPLDDWLKIDGIRAPEDALKKYRKARSDAICKKIDKLNAEIEQLKSKLKR